MEGLGFNFITPETLPEVEIISEQVLNDDLLKFEHSDDSPVPNFENLLPNKIIDPETGKKIFISQSFIKSFRKVISEALCPKRFYHTSMIKEAREGSGDAAKMGSRFEYLLTGSLNYHNEIPEPILTATGKVGADEKRIQINAELAREAFARNGFDIGQAVVSHTIKFKCLSGEYDLHMVPKYEMSEKIEGVWVFTGKVLEWAIIDIKYSGLMGDKLKRQELAWHPETIGEKFSHLCQALHYKLLGTLEGDLYLKNGLDENIPFYFFVFDNRANNEGKYEMYKISASEEKRNQHKHVILNTIEEVQNKLEGREFTAIPSYSKCQSCPVKCKDMVKYPEINLIEI